MLKNLAVAAVAVAACALGAPAAIADAPIYDCRLRSVQQDTVTGQTFEGVLVGIVAHADASAVSIRCRITVNGITRASSSVASGAGVAVTVSPVSFAAGDTDVVQVCADYSASHGSGTTCVTIGITQIPPQVVYDTVDDVLSQYWFSPLVDICWTLQQLAGNYAGGVLVINSQGDVYLNGEPQWDCPPYDMVWD